MTLVTKNIELSLVKIASDSDELHLLSLGPSAIPATTAKKKMLIICIEWNAVDIFMPYRNYKYYWPTVQKYYPNMGKGIEILNEGYIASSVLMDTER